MNHQRMVVVVVDVIGRVAIFLHEKTLPIFFHQKCRNWCGAPHEKMPIL
jgi:hypothetical protein